MEITERLLSINFTEGRRGRWKPDCIVIHVTEGNADAVRSWFKDPDAKVSAHYMVTKVGGIDQFVDEDDTAWANGRVDHPTAELVLERAGSNPNDWTISIEHEGSGHEELTPEQRKASIDLIADIHKRRDIPIDRRHVIGHHEIYSLKSCPGAISVDRLVIDAATANWPGPPPQVVWSKYFHDWLIVTRIISNREWYFIPLRNISRTTETRAQTPLNEMPLQP